MAYFKFGTLIERFSSVATSGGTTTLVFNSTKYQLFTGTASQTVILPDATTMVNGEQFVISNESTGTLSIYLHDGSTLLTTIPTGTAKQLLLTANSTTNGSFQLLSFSPAVDGTTIAINGSGQLQVASGGISNTQVNASAAIAYSKLAAIGGSTGDILVQDGGGHVSASSITTSQLFLADGSVPMAGNLNMNSHQINSLAAPSLGGDAVNLTYLQDIVTLSDLIITGAQVTGNIAGNAAGLTATLAIGSGGTGQTTAAAAITALTGSQTSGYYLRSNGTNASLAAIQAGDLPSLSSTYLALTGGTMSGAINMGSNKITSLATPTAGSDAVNKNYVDNKLSGLEWRLEANLYDAVDTTKPATTATQIDSVTVTNGMRVLFVALSSGNNEVYTAAVSGSSITWTLATDGQNGDGTPAAGDALLILNGTLYGQSAWDYNGSAWVQFNGAGQIQVSSPLSKSGNTLSLTTVPINLGGTGQTTQAAAITALTGSQTSGYYLRSNGSSSSLSAIQVGDVPTLNQNTTGTAANITATSNSTLTTLSSLVSVGTITTGAWHGTVINSTYGGTGQNFSSSTGVPSLVSGSWQVNTTTGSLGNVVYSVSPTFTGTVQFAATNNSGSAIYSSFVGLGTTTPTTWLNLQGTTPSTGSTQYGIGVVMTGTSAATANLQGIQVTLTGGNSGSPYTTSNCNSFVSFPAGAGTNQTISYFADFVAEGAAFHNASLGNAAFSDTPTPTGNSFIYQGGTDANVLGGSLTLTNTPLAISSGGTGHNTAAAAITALTGTQTAGKYLRSDGTNATLSTIQSGDVPTLNQNTTGSAAKWTTARNLAGNSVDGSANVAFANAFVVQGTTDAGLSGAQFLGALGTGIVKNTTTTGVLSIAIAADFPTLNQNTTGTAANITASSNTTLTSLSNLVTVGTIGTGTWAGTTIAINHGGTGQTTASAAFNALSPITAAGDLIIGNGTNSATNLAIGPNTYVLTSNGTTASWVASGGFNGFLSGTPTTTTPILGVGTTGPVATGDIEEASILLSLTSGTAASDALGVKVLMTSNSNVTSGSISGARILAERSAAANVSDSSGVFALITQLNLDIASTFTMTSTGNPSCIHVNAMTVTSGGTYSGNYNSISLANDTTAITGSKIGLLFSGISGGSVSNAFIADNVPASGSWFINSTSSNPSLLTGNLTLGGSLTNSTTSGQIILGSTSGATTTPVATFSTNAGGTPELVKLQNAANRNTDRGSALSFYNPNGSGSSQLGAQLISANENSTTGGPEYFKIMTGTGGTMVEAFRLSSAQNATIAGTLTVSGTGTSSFAGRINNTYSATGAGGSFTAAPTTATSSAWFEASNNSNTSYFGNESSGSALFTTATNYATIIGNTAALPIQFFTNSTKALTIDSTQNATLTGNLTVDGATTVLGVTGQSNHATIFGGNGANLAPYLVLGRTGQNFVQLSVGGTNQSDFNISEVSSASGTPTDATIASTSVFNINGNTNAVTLAGSLTVNGTTVSFPSITNLNVGPQGGRTGTVVTVENQGASNSTQYGMQIDLQSATTNSSSNPSYTWLEVGNNSTGYIAASQTSSGSWAGLVSIALRGVSSSDAGSLTGGLYGMQIDYGHYTSGTTAMATTTAYGIYVLPYFQKGTITTAYNLFLASASGNTNVPAASNYFGVYQADVNASNYFAGVTSVGPSGVRTSTTLTVENNTIANGNIFGAQVDIQGTVSTGGNYAWNYLAVGQNNAPSIATGITNSGYLCGLNSSMQRYQSADLGTLTSLYGANILFGHYSSIGSTAVTTNAYGILLQPTWNGGTVNNVYGIYIQSAATSGGTGPTSSNYFGIYQKDTAANNYFAGNVGIGTLPGSLQSLFLQPTLGTGGSSGIQAINNSTVMNGTGTNSAYYAGAQQKTSASSELSNYYSDAPTYLSGGTATSFVDFKAVGARSHTSGSSNNAAFADNHTFTGNWFINQSNTDNSTFGGQVASTYNAGSGVGQFKAVPSTTSNQACFEAINASNASYFGCESTVGGSIFSGSSSNATVLGTTNSQPIQMYISTTKMMNIATNGQITFSVISWGTGGTAVGESSGTLTTSPSSLRYKENIKPLAVEVDSSKVFDLKPVTFDYKKDGRHSFGFIAEEVQKILPCLVHQEKDENGNLRPESVSYAHLAVLLLEEMKKLNERLDKAGL